jgi:hypothetical protein
MAAAEEAMRFKNTLIWGIVLLLLIGFVYYYEIKGGQERQQAEEKAKRVFVFDEQDINQLELAYEDKVIRCTKSDQGEWQMVKPLNFPGDKQAIQRIIDTVNRATIERKLGPLEQGLAGFGLDKPKLRLKLASKDKEYVLLLGNDNPVGGFIYAQREGDPQLLLLYSSLRYSLKKDVFDLRDKRVLSVAEAEVNQIELDYPDRRLVLTNDVQAGWQITSPGKLKADPDEVSSLIRRINSMRVKEFVAEEAKKPAEFGLDKPKIALTVYTGKDQAQRRLLIGRQDADKRGVYAKRAARPQIMLLDSSVVSDLTKKVFDLRERRILKFDTAQVNELELEYPKARMQFKLEGEEWKMTRPESAPAKGYMVESMLYDLAHLKAEEFIEGTPEKKVNYGWDKPQVKVSLKVGYGNKASSMGLLIGAADPRDDKLVYVKRNDGKVFLVSKDIVEQLNKEPADLKRDAVKDR